MDPGDLPALWRSLATHVAAHRRLIAAILTGVAVLAGLDAVRPAAPATVGIWVASRDLPGGAPLRSGDMRPERLPSADLPAGVVRVAATVSGRLLAAPMRRGEPLTDVRLISAALLSATGPPGDVAVPVRVDDGGAAVSLVHAGDLVDIIATATTDDTVAPAGSSVVHDVRVLATPARDAEPDGTGQTAGLLIVAATSGQADALAQVAGVDRLSVAVRRAP
jgi:Flp pilus assembly protein CpaB